MRRSLVAMLGLSLFAVARESVGQQVPWPIGPVPPVPSFFAPVPPVIPDAPLPTPPNMLPGGAVTFTRGPEYLLKPRPNTAKVSLAYPGSPYPMYAPDNKTLLLGGKNTRLMPSGKTLAGTRAYRASFSPDSQQVATTDEDGFLSIYAVATGTLVRRYDAVFKQFGSVGSGKYNEKEVAYFDAKTIYFHTGCRLNRIDVTSPGGAVAIGTADRCGYVWASRYNAKFVIADPASKDYGVGRWYSRVSLIDLQTGALTKLADESQVGPFTDLQITHKGDRVCFMRKDRHVACAQTATGTIEQVSDGPSDRLINFDDAGEHLLYGDDAIGKGGVPHGVHIADFATKTVRRIAIVSGKVNRWATIDGNRVVVQGYDGATVFDLAKGWSMPIMSGVESEGFATNGNPKRFIAGKASGSSTDLYWIDLPD